MTSAQEHAHQSHRHGPSCGHTAVRHQGHTDYLHDGHLEHMNGDRPEEHRIEVSSTKIQMLAPADMSAAATRLATSTGLDADIRPSRMAITPITSSTDTCTIRTTAIATITGRLRQHSEGSP